MDVYLIFYEIQKEQDQVKKLWDFGVMKKLLLV